MTFTVSCNLWYSGTYIKHCGVLSFVYNLCIFGTLICLQSNKMMQENFKSLISFICLNFIFLTKATSKTFFIFIILYIHQTNLVQKSLLTFSPLYFYFRISGHLFQIVSLAFCVWTHASPEHVHVLFLSGMHYLHAEAPVKVIHRDLKSRNGNTRSKSRSCCSSNSFSLNLPFSYSVLPFNAPQLLIGLCSLFSSGNDSRQSAEGL